MACCTPIPACCAQEQLSPLQRPPHPSLRPPLGARPALPSAPCPRPGVRTGYCGSLTTFASWQLQLMREAIESNQVGAGRVGRRAGAADSNALLPNQRALTHAPCTLHPPPTPAAPPPTCLRVAGVPVDECAVWICGGAVRCHHVVRAGHARSAGGGQVSRARAGLPPLPCPLHALSLARALGLARQHTHTLPALHPACAAPSRPPIPTRPHAPPLPPRWGLSDGEDVLQELEAYRSQELQYLRSSTGSGAAGGVGAGSSRAGGGSGAAGAVSRPESPQQLLLERAEPDLPRLSPLPAHSRGEQEQRQQEQALGGQPAAAAAAANGHGGAAPPPHQQQKPAQGARLAVMVAKEAPPEAAASYHGWRTDGAACVALLLLTAGFAAGAGLETQHTWLRTLWLSCLLGPFG